MIKLEYLEQLAEKYGTDKRNSEGGHGYITHYAKHLPERCRTFLEIGVAEGNSASMWDEFYGKDELELSLIDLFINPEFVSQRYCWNRGWKTYKGDQSDYGFLYTIKEMFDVIVEDGSHDSIHQIISFQHLFINNLKGGGLWVTEDLHCCTMEHYRQRGNLEYEETLLAVLKRYKETGKFSGGLFGNESFNFNELFETLVDTVDIYDDKIAFLKKKLL